MFDCFARAKQVSAIGFVKAKPRYAYPLLFAMFFVVYAQAGSQAAMATSAEQVQEPTLTSSAEKPLEAEAAPNVTAAAPPAPTKTIANKPTLADGDTPTADMPIKGNPSGTLAELPAAKRLAISVLAGVFTLIAALWIGARRD